jgi:hypothetical protein
MNAAPLVVVADAKVFYQRLVIIVLNGNGECLHPIRRSYQTTVAIGLFLIGVVLLYHAMVKTV